MLAILKMIFSMNAATKLKPSSSSSLSSTSSTSSSPSSPSPSPLSRLYEGRRQAEGESAVPVAQLEHGRATPGEDDHDHGENDHDLVDKANVEGDDLDDGDGAGDGVDGLGEERGNPGED